MIKRLVVFLMCLSAILSLFGCGKKDKYILDGPGMVNTPTWESFSVSRSGDSYAQHNFNIIVKYREDGYVVKGTFLGYIDEVEFVLPDEACRKIDELRPHNLPDYIKDTSADIDENLIVLDAPEVNVEVAYTNGTLLKKVDEDDFSIKVYEIVSPYLND